MINRLEALEDWAAGVLWKLEPASRNRLARSLGQTSRLGQQKRIVAQRNPDGRKYAPRNLRSKQGRLKRKIKMFQKLRSTRFLKVRGDSNALSVGFTGRIARIAKVHQFGLKDRGERRALDIRYKKRELLGLNEADLELIRGGLLSHLTGL